MKRNISIYLVILIAILIAFDNYAQTIKTEGFEGSYLPAGWSMYSSPSSYAWSKSSSMGSPTANPHTGSYLITYPSYNANSGYYSYIRTPRIDYSQRGSNVPTVKFWMIRDAGYPSNYDRVEVYIHTNETIDGATLLGTVNRNTTLSPVVASFGWYQYSYEIPAQFNTGTNYIFFKAVSAYGNNMAIDDIEWTEYPVPMTFSSSTTEQASVERCIASSINQEIIRLKITTENAGNPINIQSISFSTSGTSNTSDILNAKVYYTTSSTFSTTEQYGSISLTPNGEFTIEGSKSLIEGDNYFWLSYDINSTVTTGNFVDAQCIRFVTNEPGEMTRTPSVTDPAGKRELQANLSGEYLISATGGNYTNLNEAIADLNLVGVGVGGVIFNIPGGETFNEPALINITASGLQDRPIVFRKQGGTNERPIFVFLGTGNTDAAIKISGGDYIVFDSIEIRTPAEHYSLEYGFHLVGTASDGCRFDTIRNCLIDFAPENDASVGIFLKSSATSLSGINYHNKFLNNIIQETVSGYKLDGNTSYKDIGNEIGTYGIGVSLIRNLGKSTSGVSIGVSFLGQDSLKIRNTKFENFRSYNYIYGIVENGESDNVFIYSNELTDFNTERQYQVIYGISMNRAGTKNIYQNKIHNFSSGLASITGINITDGNANVYKNEIYDFRYTGSSSASLTGISISGDGSNGIYNIYNNYIYNLNSPNGILSNSYGILYPNVKAIYLYKGKQINLFNNSIILKYTSTSSDNYSTCAYIIYESYYANTIKMNNNIFVNLVDVSTAGRFATVISHESTTITHFASSNNKNLFYAGVPSEKNLLYYDQTNADQTLEQFKARFSPREQGAITENPPFTDLSTWNVRLKTDVPTQIESGGIPITTPVAITDDFFGTLRNANFPDIGAEEGNFIIDDRNPPEISYTPFTDDIIRGSRTVADISIIDGKGVDVADGTKPRLYFKKTTDPNVWNSNTSETSGWKYVEASGTTSPFSFTIDYSKLNSGSVLASDSIQYFLIAQDIATTPNVTINSGTPSAALTTVALSSSHFPILGTIYKYKVFGNISGTKTVGIGGDYITLTAAINDLNAKIINGPVTFSLIDDSYPNETYPIVINPNIGSNSTNTILIKPSAGKSPVFSGPASGSGIIKINGADYITIDGSNESEGTDRNITLNNSYTSYSAYSAALWIAGASAGNGSTNITVKNCKLSAGSNTSYYYGLFVGGSTLGANGFDNDNLVIQNNEITKAYFGLYIFGSSTGVYNNISIENNMIGSATSGSYLSNTGLYISYCDETVIRGNTIRNVVYSSSSITGVNISSGSKNVIFDKNTIYGLRANTSSSGGGACGLQVHPSNSESNIIISNNILYNITASGYSSLGNSAIEGIRILSGQGIYIYYNSVNLYGNISRVTEVDDQSAAIYISNNASNLTLKNNIFKNSIVNTTGVATAWAIYSGATADKYTAIDYNNYFAGGSQGKLGLLASQKLDIAAWRTATGQDLHSLNQNTYFQSESQLYVPNYSPLKNGGTPIAGITTDYSGNPRNVTNPFIGAYEIGFDPAPISGCNIQSPGTYSKGKGTLGFTVYAQVYIEGVTLNAGQTPDLEAYIGYSTTNNDPSNWTNWTPASFNTQVGNNDEFQITLGENFAIGTYYYASKFVYKGMPVKYGGYSSDGGGIWGGSNISGVLTVNDATITWCNLQSPATVTQTEGSEFTVYGRVYADGVTNLTGEQPGLKAWIGWNYENTNPATWAETQWKEAAFNTEIDNNDEYKAVIGANMRSGSAYYATRFQILSDAFVYGGYSVGGGNFWDGSDYISGVAIVNEKIVSSFPYFEGMEQDYFPPPGWRDQDNEWFSTFWSYSGMYAAGIDYESKGNLVTNSFILPQNMRISFNWIDEDPMIGPLLAKTKDINNIEAIPYDSTYFEISTDGGTTWIKVDSLKNEDAMSEWERQTYDLSDYGNKTVKFRWRNETDASYDAYVFILDNVKIEKKPSASFEIAIPAYNYGLHTFTNTGVKIQYPENSEGFTLIIDKIEGSPGGTLPGTLVNFAPYYWSFIVEGYLDPEFTSTIILDLSGLTGINNFETLHLLRREDPNHPWEDLGEPYSANAGVCTWTYVEGFSEFVIAGGPDNPLPIELSSFTATANKRDVTINWETETEINSSFFNVERENEDKSWNPITDKSGKVIEIKAAGNSNSLKTYSVVDKNLNFGSYNYRLKMVDNDGSFKYSQLLSVAIDLPNIYDLSQNYPNPFNPSTIINYQLPKDSKVLLELYSITGEKIATFIDGDIEAGYHKYELNLNKFKLSSGVYFYRIIADDFSSVKKMMILK